MIPFAFSAMTMTSVGYAAQDMMEECRMQFKEILQDREVREEQIAGGRCKAGDRTSMPAPRKRRREDVARP